MHVIAWRFRVKPERTGEFEKEYGPDGSWVRLFRRAAGYVRTDLLPSQGSATEFVTLDYWETKEDFERFRLLNGDEYDQIDRRLAGLTIHEERVTPEEISPVDEREQS